MSIVVKVGGALLEDPRAAVEAVRRVSAEAMVIVHGGGIQITRMLERMKISSQFIDGLRVTDENTLVGVASALMGEVHTVLIQELRQQGLPAIGLFGAVHASKKPGPWGLVGTDVQGDASVLNAVLQSGHLPVVPTLAVGPGTLLNVNGDETAAAVALAVRARQLIFLTDVDGVKDAQGRVIDRLAQPGELLTADFVGGGMIPKLRAVKAAMDGGVRLVRVGRTVFGGSP